MQPNAHIRDAEVLIVEDNPGDARLLQTLLEETTLEPLHFTHIDRLDEARDWLENNVADAVLLDLGLPDTEGLESLTALLPDARHVPVVVVSGNDDARVRREVVARGAVDFVAKDNLDAERLARSLRAALEQSRLVTELDRARRSARLAQAELAELVVQLEVPVVVVAPDHRILYANAAAGRLFGTEAPRLRGTALAVPVDRTRSRRVELTDTHGVQHELDASAVPAHWRGHPAYLVMLEPSVRDAEDSTSKDTHETLMTIASEIGAHALRLGGSLSALEQRHDTLLDLGRALVAPPHGDPGQRRHAAAGRSVLTLAQQARDTLATAQDDLVRIRRLALFAQRSTEPLVSRHRGRESSDTTVSPGLSRELCSIGVILDQVCRAIHGRYGADVHIVADTHGPRNFPADAATAREIVERLLAGLVAASHERNAGALKLRIRTSGATNCVLVSVDAFPDRCIEEYRSRVLRLLVGQPDALGLDHDLTRSSAAIRDAGGNLRCGSGEDGRLWLQISLPDRGPN